MSLPYAYCVQTGCCIDITAAHESFFAQPEPRQELEFLCPDEECRNIDNPPAIVGVNYYRLPTEEFVQKPHFRLRHPERHRAGCPWIEVVQALEEIEKEDGRSVSSLKTSDLIDVFNPHDPQDDEPDLRIDAAIVADISALPTRRARIDAYKDYFRKNPNKTSRLSEVVSCFKAMSEKELSTAKLTIEGLGEKTYRQHFKYATFCKPSANPSKIYYGTVIVKEQPTGFELTFFKLATQANGIAASVGVFISHEMLAAFRGRYVLLALLRDAIDTGGNALFCGVFGSVVLEEREAKPHLSITIQSLHSLALMLNEFGAKVGAK